ARAAGSAPACSRTLSGWPSTYSMAITGTPSLSSTAKMVQTLGWFSAAAARASARTDDDDGALPALNTLRATVRSSTVSWATQTRGNPPVPDPRLDAVVPNPVPRHAPPRRVERPPIQPPVSRPHPAALQRRQHPDHLVAAAADAEVMHRLVLQHAVGVDDEQ